MFDVSSTPGVAYGGSGAPLDEVKYAESVAFWSKYVALK